MPNWAWVHRELRRPDVTLALLWEEYRASAPDGFGYSWFCDLYRGWAGRLKPTMRQTHLAGEKLFVDFAGRTGEVVDGLTGEILPVQIFVAVLGASSLVLHLGCGHPEEPPRARPDGAADAQRNYLTNSPPRGSVNATELLSQLPQLCQSGARLPDQLS